jgi:hypothetical protein
MKMTLALAVVAASLAPGKGADVPPIAVPDPPPIEGRVSDLERRMEVLERILKEVTGRPKSVPFVSEPPRATMELEPTPYAEVLRRVKDGEKIVLLVRPPANPGLTTTLPVRIGWTTLRSNDAPMPPGRYDCYHGVADDGTLGPVMKLVDAFVAVSGVAAPTSFDLGAGSTRPTTVLPVAVRNTRSVGPVQTGLIPTLVGRVGQLGFTNRG